MRPATSLLFRWLVGVVFTWAGAVKLLDPLGFLVSIYGYETHLPEPLIRLAVVILPWLEILTGLVLITGIALKAGLILCAARPGRGVWTFRAAASAANSRKRPFSAWSSSPSFGI